MHSKLKNNSNLPTKESRIQNFKYHYFYKITKTDTGEYYYGIHSTNNLHDGYMGSGTRIRRLLKQFDKNLFKKEILKYFDNRQDLLDYEESFITKDIIQETLCLNMNLGGNCSREGVTTKGLVTVIDKNGNTFDVSVNDPRYLSGELLSPNTGKVVVRDENGKCIKISVDDPRYLLGEYQIVTKGNSGFKHWTTIYKNGDFKTIRVEELNEYLQNGWEKRGHTKGRTSPTKGMIWITKETKQKLINVNELDKYISEGWIQNNRITRPTSGLIMIHKDGDNKYCTKEELEGYLQEGWIVGGTSRNKGKLTVTADNGETWFQINKDDSHFKNGHLKTKTQLCSTCKGRIYMHKENKFCRIEPHKVIEMLDNGWKIGKLNKPESKIFIRECRRRIKSNEITYEIINKMIYSFKQAAERAYKKSQIYQNKQGNSSLNLFAEAQYQQKRDEYNKYANELLDYLKDKTDNILYRDSSIELSMKMCKKIYNELKNNKLKFVKYFEN